MKFALQEFRKFSTDANGMFIYFAQLHHSYSFNYNDIIPIEGIL